MIMRMLGLLLLWTLVLPAAAHAAPTVDGERRILVMLRLAPPHFRSGTGYTGGYGEDQSLAGRQRIAAGIARRHGVTLGGNWPMPIIGIDCFIMIVPAGRDTKDSAEEIAHDRAVRWAQPIARYQALGADRTDARADPLFAAQPAAKAWHLAALHRVATGRHVKIAVIDSGIDAAHPDLAGQVAVSRDFVDGHGASAEDHGTGVAGVIAAKTGNGLGISGIAPDARLYAMRACWQPARAPTVCDTLSLAKAIALAVEQRVDIINLSLGGPADRLIATLLKVGMARGIAVVAAFDTTNAGGFPASLDGVIAVSGSPVEGLRGPYSAPGRDIPTTQPGRRFYLVSGASYAAAEVSGLLALVREKRGSGVGARNLVSARVAGGEIDGCATLLGKSPACDAVGGGPGTRGLR
ncbi:S8 family serine peptidase [Sphingomonas sp. GB1N7]